MKFRNRGERDRVKKERKSRRRVEEETRNPAPWAPAGEGEGGPDEIQIAGEDEQCQVCGWPEQAKVIDTPRETNNQTGLRQNFKTAPFEQDKQPQIDHRGSERRDLRETLKPTKPEWPGQRSPKNDSNQPRREALRQKPRERCPRVGRKEEEERRETGGLGTRRPTEAGPAPPCQVSLAALEQCCVVLPMHCWTVDPGSVELDDGWDSNVDADHADWPNGSGWLIDPLVNPKKVHYRRFSTIDAAAHVFGPSYGAGRLLAGLEFYCSRKCGCIGFSLVVMLLLVGFHLHGDGWTTLWYSELMILRGKVEGCNFDAVFCSRSGGSLPQFFPGPLLLHRRHYSRGMCEEIWPMILGPLPHRLVDPGCGLLISMSLVFGAATLADAVMHAVDAARCFVARACVYRVVAYAFGGLLGLGWCANLHPILIGLAPMCNHL
ncbi:hypothetical protein Nepgr_023980 [Nepenthes gracilis]|uniref:Uncharacterized protein n=1 Tax=Nepenthes gracilis TaxID=150966 RepID=A0AAD3XY72_NEPGR|nr:hypothetical protein Nepgr_023980 [Nepenthes gracilis]